MREIFFCPNCMEKISEGDLKCPFCGKDTHISAEPHHLPVNSILNGRYVIGKALGAGGFGITYIAYDLKMESKTAVKEYYMTGAVSRTRSLTVLPTDERAEENFTKGKVRFWEEAKVLAQFISEPGIVHVKDFFEENGTAYIAMEYIDGENLSHYLKREGPQSFEKIMEMLEPVMRALDKVHRKGLVHRDISPSNLMLEKDGSVKLLDFGAARDQSLQGENSLSVMLKPGYAPVEQYRSHGKQGPWTDVYAMCATIYRMLTGKVPPASTERAFDDQLEPPSKLGVKISSQQETALLRGLAVNSEERIGSMDELLQCLKGNKKPKARIRWKKLTILSAVVLTALGCMALIMAFVGTDKSKAPLITWGGGLFASQGEWVTKVQPMMVRMTYISDSDPATTIYDYEYDKYGNCLSLSYSYAYSDPYSVEYSYYVDKGTGESKMISRKLIESGSVTEYISFREEYREEEGKIVLCEYDENDTLIGWSVTEENGNETWVYYYYPNGKLRSYYIYVDGESSYREEQYDSRGQLIFSMEDTLDDRGYVLTRVKTFYEDEEVSSSYTENYTRDDQGRILSGSQVFYLGQFRGELSIEAEYEEMTIKVWQPRGD